jgi:hypothetical protein
MVIGPVRSLSSRAPSQRLIPPQTRNDTYEGRVGIAVISGMGSAATGPLSQDQQAALHIAARLMQALASTDRRA